MPGEIKKHIPKRPTRKQLERIREKYKDTYTLLFGYQDIGTLLTEIDSVTKSLKNLRASLKPKRQIVVM